MLRMTDENPDAAVERVLNGLRTNLRTVIVKLIEFARKKRRSS
jgi:hypothetical protein